MPELPASQPLGSQPPAPPPADAAADELLERLRVATRGEYDIFGELGRGGMATVYLAHEIALDRKVAIKVMSPAMVHGPGMVERFKREARTSASLSHPNIIPVYAVREADGLLFFVMKLVEGTPLDAIIRELGQLPIPMVEAILAQVSGAFGYAHRHGVIHRDIKPSNILIDDEGWAVVTDFGIAKVQASEELTQTGTAVGTPTYMSPEQCSGGQVTGASDQYSLGVVAYEMLAGRPPFTGGSMMALMYSHFNESPAALESLRPDCPEPIRAAVMRMLQKDPAARWPSMEEAVAAMGARPLAHDDPTRSQLISLARTGLTHRIVSQVQTPRSPIPFTKRSGTATPLPTDAVPARALGRGMLVAAAALAVVGIGALLLTRRGGPGSGPGASTGEASAVTPPAAGSTGVAAVVPPPPPLPAPAGRPAQVSLTAPGTAGTTVPDRGAPAEPRQETVASDPAPLPPPVAAPAPSPPAVTAAAPPPAIAPAPAPAAGDPRAEVTAVIQSFARAIGAGDLPLARRIYPGMPSEQQQGLEALWRAGGSMTPQWSVADIVVDGDAATARVTGTNSVVNRRGRPGSVPVNLRARFERRGGEWRLVSLVN